MSEQPRTSDQAEHGRDESAQQVEGEGATPEHTRTSGEEQVDDALGGAQDPGAEGPRDGA